MRHRSLTAAIAALVWVVACIDSAPPPRPVIGSFTIHAGDEQGGEVGQPLPQPLQVMVRSVTGEPVAGVEVLWTAYQSGSVTATSVTGTDGIARATRTIGPTVGEYWTMAGSAEAMASGQLPVRFTSYGRVDGGYLMGTRTIGPFTDNTLGTNDQPLAVMITNEKGEPVPGVVVTWQALNGGTLSETSVPTDAGGESIVAFTYGPEARSYTVEASKTGLGTISFQLTATAGNPVAIVKSGGDELSVPAGGQVVYTVTAQDARGNPANGARIEWAMASGGGSITPASNFTGGNGTASATRTLGTAAGAQTATATAPELPGAPSVTFTTTATAQFRRP